MVIRNEFQFKLHELIDKKLPTIDGKGLLIKDKMCLMRRPINNTRLPKKYIKKLFKRPEKAYCKECNGSMTRLVEQGRENAVLFSCDGNGNPVSCGNFLDLSSYSNKFEGGKFTFNVKRLEKPKKPRVVGPVMVKETILIMKRIRLKDKFYVINDDLSYNPVKKIFVERNMEFTADEKMDKEYLKLVRLSLQNG